MTPSTTEYHVHATWVADQEVWQAVLINPQLSVRAKTISELLRALENLGFEWLTAQQLWPQGVAEIDLVVNGQARLLVRRS